MLLASYLAHVEEWNGGKAKMQAAQKRVAQTLRPLKMNFGTFANIAISKALAEAEERGGIECVYAPQPLTPKLATRLTELDKALKLEGGIANAVLGCLLRDFMDGQADVIHGQWELGKDAARCHGAFFRLVDRWRKEDGLPRLSWAKRSLFDWTGEPEHRGTAIIAVRSNKVKGLKLSWGKRTMKFTMDPPTYRAYQRKAKRLNLPSVEHALLDTLEKRIGELQDQNEGRAVA